MAQLGENGRSGLNDTQTRDFGCSLKAASVGDFLQNDLFAIPSYQRKFSWGYQETERLCTEIFTYYARSVEKFIDLANKTNASPRAPIDLKNIAVLRKAAMIVPNKKSEATSIYQKSNPESKFVGTLILVEDKSLSQQMTGTEKLVSVIDGQQRLTTFCLFFTCLYYRLLGLKQFFLTSVDCGSRSTPEENRKSSDGYKTVLQDLEVTCSKLEKCLVHELDPEGKQAVNWPRIARELEDGDACNHKELTFKSDTARILFYTFGLGSLSTEGIITAKNDQSIAEGKSLEDIIAESKKSLAGLPEEELLHIVLNEPGQNIQITDMPEAVVSVVETIGAFLDTVCIGKDPLGDLTFPDKEERFNRYPVEMPETTITFEDICEFAGVRKGCGVFKFDHMTDLLKDPYVRAYVRLASLAHYAMNNVYMAAVICQPNNFLDIFESLNSAGRPLTPIETFVPEVHKFFGNTALDLANARGATKPEEQDIYLRKDIWRTSPEESQELYQGLRSDLSIAPVNLLSAIQSLLEYNQAVDASTIIVSLAVQLTGKKCPATTPSELKKFLNKSFNEAVVRYHDLKKDGKTEEQALYPIWQFLDVLYQTVKWWCIITDKDVDAKFDSLFNCTKIKGDASSDILQKIEEAKFCLLMLRDANFDLAQSIACRYYIQFVESTEKTRLTAFTYYLDVIRALGAFTAMWRSSFATTSGIDQAFRTLLLGRDWQKKAGEPFDGTEWLPLTLFAEKTKWAHAPSNCEFDNDGLITAETMRIRMRALLNEKVGDKARSSKGFTTDSWANAMHTSLTGKLKNVSKFLLIAYMHNTVPDTGEENAGLRKLERSTDRNDGFFTAKTWRDTYSSSRYQLEHVIPQNHDIPEWRQVLDNAKLDKQGAEQIVQELGNLLLLPSLGNNVIGNDPWSRKKIAYQCMGSKDLNNVDALKQSLNINDSSERMKQALEQLLDAPAANSVKEFAGVECPEWDVQFVHKRSKRMAEILWDNFEPFLDLNKGIKEWEDARNRKDKKQLAREAKQAKDEAKRAAREAKAAEREAKRLAKEKAKEEREAKRLERELKRQEKAKGKAPTAEQQGNDNAPDAGATTSVPQASSPSERVQPDDSKVITTPQERNGEVEGEKQRIENQPASVNQQDLSSLGKVAEDINSIDVLGPCQKTEDAIEWTVDGKKIAIKAKEDSIILEVPKLKALRLRGVKKAERFDDYWEWTFASIDEWNTSKDALIRFIQRNITG